ncbi:MAG: hypothetical protein MJZ76_08635 [Bacteroidales bacterium]|nr:hypothetical protein [Bacteroidales bacterium]
MNFMKKIIFIIFIIVLICFIYRIDTESNGTPDCVAEWKYVGTFEAIESAENSEKIAVRLYKNIMGDKSFKVVVKRKKDGAFIFARYENECYSCTIDDGIAYFKIGNSLWSVNAPHCLFHDRQFPPVSEHTSSPIPGSASPSVQ